LYPFSKILLAIIFTCITFQIFAAEEKSGISASSLSLFPILMYDSDIGFGFGGKGMIKNHFKSEESFDLILFASSKGEQWYMFNFSIPDKELRQGTTYSLALDIKIEFDKILKSNFFGFGNDSEDNEYQFPREHTRLELFLGRAFTKHFILENGFTILYSSVYDFENVNPIMSANIPGSGEALTSYLTYRLILDTRKSQIHPHRGWKMSFNFDLANEILGGDFDFQRYRLELNKYQELPVKNHILAARLWIQNIEGTAPYYEQSMIGGTWTGRGFKKDRFIDRAFILSSLEYRFPLYKRLGGVLFVDSGRVMPGIKQATFKDWNNDWGLGLRYYLKNFLVRFDTGFSDEGNRIFFHFGHVF